MAFSYLRTMIAGSLITLLLCGQAIALTVFDVIQLSDKNYTDDDIIALIEVTDSAFELQAEDITQLMKLGVSETVIQTMLQTKPDKTAHIPATDTATPHADQSDNKTPHEAHHSKNTTKDVAETFIPPAQNIAGGILEVKSFQESGAGHHSHSAIYLSGVQLLILRAEGIFPSIQSRGKAVVKRLEQIISLGDGNFRPDRVNGADAVVFYKNSKQTPIVVMNVSESDANAYQRRSGRKVNSKLLAAYWSDLLSDYWSIVVDQTTPTRLSKLHEGEALTALYEQWETASKTDTNRLQDAVQRLPQQEQQHLLRMAAAVPHDFRMAQSHRMKQP